MSRPGQEAGHFRVGGPGGKHIFSVFETKLTEDEPVGFNRLRTGFIHDQSSFRFKIQMRLLLNLAAEDESFRSSLSPLYPR